MLPQTSEIAVRCGVLAYGKRVAKSNGKLYWYGMSADVLSETNATGGTINEYVFFGGRRIARRNSSGTVFFYVQDHLGTSRAMLTVGSLAPCYEADYYPFGGERVITNNCPQDYKFTGQERDTETGLDYFIARHYSFGYGRFVSPDLPFADQHPVDAQSWNLYAYVRNNPLNAVDPSGRDCIEILDEVYLNIHSEMAAAWANFYLRVAGNNPSNAVAAQRAQQMREIAAELAKRGK